MIIGMRLFLVGLLASASIGHELSASYAVRLAVAPNQSEQSSMMSKMSLETKLITGAVLSSAVGFIGGTLVKASKEIGGIFGVLAAGYIVYSLRQDRERAILDLVGKEGLAASSVIALATGMAVYNR